MSELPAIRAQPDGSFVIEVAARPGQPKSAVVGVHGGALKVTIAAPPEKGKANEELVRWLAKALGVGRGSVVLVKGEASREKAVRVVGIERGMLEERIRGLLG